MTLAMTAVFARHAPTLAVFRLTNDIRCFYKGLAFPTCAQFKPLCVFGMKRSLHFVTECEVYDY
jgi:hypothetical protein